MCYVVLYGYAMGGNATLQASLVAEAFGRDVSVVRGDASDPGALSELARVLRAAGRPVDVVVANAGVGGDAPIGITTTTIPGGSANSIGTNTATTDSIASRRGVTTSALASSTARATGVPRARCLRALEDVLASRTN